MKFVMSLVLAASFATPAFASDSETKAIKQIGELKERQSTKRSKDKAAEIDAIKQMGELKERMAKSKEVIDITQFVSEEDKNKMNSYRLTEIKDPSEDKALDSDKRVSVGPWFGNKRQRILTPPEYQREQEQGKNTTYAGSEVGKHYSRAVGAKVKIKIGAKQ